MSRCWYLGRVETFFLGVVVGVWCLVVITSDGMIITSVGYYFWWLLLLMVATSDGYYFSQTLCSVLSVADTWKGLRHFILVLLWMSGVWWLSLLVITSDDYYFWWLLLLPDTVFSFDCSLLCLMSGITSLLWLARAWTGHGGPSYSCKPSHRTEYERRGLAIHSNHTPSIPLHVWVSICILSHPLIRVL